MSLPLSKMKVRTRATWFLPSAWMVLILSLVGAGFCATTVTLKDEIKAVSSSPAPQTPAFSHSTERRVKPLASTVATNTATSVTKGSTEITKARVTNASPTVSPHSATKVYTGGKGVVKSARKQKLNTSSSALGAPPHSPARFQERLGAIDCDLPLLPNGSRLWRGNETHELNLPVTECAGAVGAGRGGTAAPDDDCPPVIVSWEGFVDIQSGDILIVRIADSLLLESFGQHDVKKENSTGATNTTRAVDDRVHHTPLQPAVYQVTRQGHEHCDITEGMLLDITPLDENGAKLFTLYDKDLSEGVNLYIVVSKNWGSQCVRLKVTVKSDNCGESQDCSGKGVCYTNVSMEGYECQCCPGFAAPHCEERDSCNPSPCLNNGICVDLTQPLRAAAEGSYHCLCPYGFTGRKCEKDPCSSAPCLNGGSCMSMAMNGTTTFHCACAEGWTGANCELFATGGVCASNPCVNGICIEQTDNDIAGLKYRCFCQPGYTGDRCQLEYNECESSPCAHGGTCTDRVGGFECACGRGYTGNTCQRKVDLCTPDPCPERRYCVDRGNSYSCECPHGYVGDECSLPARSPCDNNPCAHGGTCWSGVDSFYCSCRPDYTGKLCEEDFYLESVMGEGEALAGGGGSVREVRLPLGLYHDRLHNVYIAAGTLGAAIAIVGVVVTACHCRVNKTYSRVAARARGAWRARRGAGASPPHHWLDDKRSYPPHSPHPSLPQHPPALDTTDMYYTLDFSDSQSSPLIQ